MANKFTLKGYGVEVDYTIGGNPAFPALNYKDATISKSFLPSAIHTDSTDLGNLVTVALEVTIDAGGIALGETCCLVILQPVLHRSGVAVVERLGDAGAGRRDGRKLPPPPMTDRMTPFDELVGLQSSHLAGDAIGHPEHLHPGGEPRTYFETLGCADVVADGAPAVHLAVAAGVGDERE